MNGDKVTFEEAVKVLEDGKFKVEAESNDKTSEPLNLYLTTE